MVQTTILSQLALGVPGERYTDAPHRAQSGVMVSTPQLNVIGATAYTLTSQAGEGSPAIVQAGGTGAYMGILANPKIYASPGAGGVPLAPTMTLPDQAVGELALAGEYVLTLPAAANIGDLLQFDQTTGALSTVAPVAAFTGVIAVTTGVLTVSALTAGSIGLGTALISGGAVVAHVTGLGTGTGGNGTYTTDIITAVGSGPMTAATVAASGKTIIPGATVSRFNVSGAGIGVVKL